MTRTLPPLVAACLALAPLAGCDTQQPPAPVPADIAAAAGGGEGPAEPEDGGVAAPVAGAAGQVDDIGGGTTGGDGSPLVLSPLAPGDLRGIDLAGELACSFAAEAGGSPLLIARGDVADADGRASFAVKIGDVVQQGLALADGGFDAMLEGGRFGTKGMVLTVGRVGAPTRRGGESPALPAELLAQRADGAERVFPGTWTCGP